MKHDPHQADAKAYNSVVGRTTLGTIRMMDCKFEIKPEALTTDVDVWRKEVFAEPLQNLADVENGKLFGVFEFSLDCRHKRRKVLSCASKFFVSFRVLGDFQAEVGELFVQRVGKVMVYPYFRSTVAQLAAQAGLQMPPLPIISLQPRSVGSATELQEAAPRGDPSRSP